MKENPCEAFGKSGCSPVVGKSKTGRMKNEKEYKLPLF